MSSPYRSAAREGKATAGSPHASSAAPGVEGPERDRLTRAPLFVVGAPRSGTSLLYKALCLHPAAAYVSNWVQRYPGVLPFAVLNRLARLLPGVQLTTWFAQDSNAYVYGTRRALPARAFPMPAEGEPLYFRCGVPPHRYAGTPVPEPDQRSALRSAFASVQRYGGGTCLVSKRIANNQRIPLLRDAFPGARFVRIVRDGRAVAHSLSGVDWWRDAVVWWYGDSPRRWEAEGGDPWELCARHWVEEVRAVEEGLAAVPRERVVTVHYERLVRELVPTLREIAAFAGFPEDPRWSRRLQRLQRLEANESWRRRLDPEAVATIERVQGPTLRRLGYDA